MDIAVVALTKRGSELARNIASQEPAKVDLYIPQKFALPGEHPFTEPLRQMVPKLLKGYSGVAFIMALGIVVRVVAPHLESKQVDPAIVCLDEGGSFVISVASGHLGGANELAAGLAQRLGALPVITTATDVQGKIAFDVLARKLNLAIEPFQNLKTLNSAVVNDQSIKVFSELSPGQLGYSPEEEAWQNIEVRSLTEFSPGKVADTDYLVLITNKVRADFPESEITLYLRPKNIIAGVGCRRGVHREQVLEALETAFQEAGLSLVSLKKIVSVDLKSDEAGLLAAGQQLGIPLEFIPRMKLEDFLKSQPQLEQSDFVKAKIGVGGVCEPAAMITAKQARLILSKQKLQGITVALAEERL
ncbi:MAG TPA: cobalt-precorrin 5A hydrolase [Bacillota bacterium]|nr:cobalt-precorrin 5A hydrolase [Bacillota bacterium]